MFYTLCLVFWRNSADWNSSGDKKKSIPVSRYLNISSLLLTLLKCLSIPALNTCTIYSSYWKILII